MIVFLLFKIAEDVNTLFLYTIPFAHGNNYFDSSLNYSRKSIYSFGAEWSLNTKIGIEVKIINLY